MATQTVTRSLVDALLEKAEQPRYKDLPPTEFIQWLGLSQSSLTFCCAAWMLFKQKRSKITLSEVQKHLNKKSK